MVAVDCAGCLAQRRIIGNPLELNWLPEKYNAVAFAGLKHDGSSLLRYSGKK
jgi:hypothetical protein